MAKEKGEGQKRGVLESGISSRTLLATDHDPTVALVSLTEQVLELNAALDALRHELLEMRMKEARTADLVSEIKERVDSGLDPVHQRRHADLPAAESASLPTFEPDLEPEPEAENYYEPASEGEFWPFTLEGFGEEIDLAMANQVEIDWGRVLTEPTVEEIPAELDSLEMQAAFESMVTENPDLIDFLKEFNESLPPDFVQEDPLTELLSLSVQPEPTSLEPEPAFAVPSMEQEMANLLREAEFSEASPLSDFPTDNSFAESLAPAWEMTPAWEDPVSAPQSAEWTPEAIESAPMELAARALALPLRIEDDQLVCLIAKPWDEEALTELELACGRTLRRETGTYEVVLAGLRSAYEEKLDSTEREAMLFDAVKPDPISFWQRFRFIWGGA